MSDFTPWPELAEIARREVGVREVTRNDAPRIRQYWSAVPACEGNWKVRAAWCAGFVSWCVREADPEWEDRPAFEGVSEWLGWCIKHAEIVCHPDQGVFSKEHAPSAGDIVIFLPHFSHIGIVTGWNDGAVETIEGNTNDEGSREGDGVYARRRSLSIIGSIWRLP